MIAISKEAKCVELLGKRAQRRRCPQGALFLAAARGARLEGNRGKRKPAAFKVEMDTKLDGKKIIA